MTLERPILSVPRLIGMLVVLICLAIAYFYAVPTYMTNPTDQKIVSTLLIFFSIMICIAGVILVIIAQEDESLSLRILFGCIFGGFGLFYLGYILTVVGFFWQIFCIWAVILVIVGGGLAFYKANNGLIFSICSVIFDVFSFILAMGHLFLIPNGIVFTRNALAAIILSIIFGSSFALFGLSMWAVGRDVKDQPPIAKKIGKVGFIFGTIMLAFYGIWGTVWFFIFLF
jgi:hypothetical protein